MRNTMTNTRNTTDYQLRLMGALDVEFDDLDSEDIDNMLEELRDRFDRRRFDD